MAFSIASDQLSVTTTHLAYLNSAEAASYLRGVATVGDPPRPLLCLDLEKVLTNERLRPFRREGQRGAA